MNAVSLKEYREKLKSLGICPACHSNKAREGMITCEACSKQRYQNKIKMQAKGLCRECGTKLKETKSRCQECANINKKYNTKLKSVRRESGLCVECGVESEGYRLCVNCQEKENIRKSLSNSL